MKPCRSEECLPSIVRRSWQKQHLTDCAKILLISDAIRGEDPFAYAPCIDSDLREAIDWLAARTPVEVNKYRLGVVEQIEAVNLKMKQSGKASSWFKGADAHVYSVLLFAQHNTSLFIACGLPGSQGCQWPPHSPASQAVAFSRSRMRKHV